MKWFLMFLVFGLIGCETLMNAIPGDNSNNSLQLQQQISPEQLKRNKAFLKNIEGNWTNHIVTANGVLVYTVSEDGHFFYTNSSSSADGSFTLETNYSFYSAQSETMGIFSNKNSKKFTGFRKYKTNLGIEAKSYDSPDKVNSSTGYVLYNKK